MNPGQYRVVAGPYRVARNYAERMGWPPDEYVIVTRAHQLARLDPAQIVAIITVKLHTLGRRVMTEIHDEMVQVKRLWPVPVTAAA